MIVSFGKIFYGNLFTDGDRFSYFEFSTGMMTVSTAGEWKQARRLTAQEETVTLTVFLAPLSTPVLPRRLSKSRRNVHNHEVFAHNHISPANLRMQDSRFS
jgi:hypothetical protein